MGTQNPNTDHVVIGTRGSRLAVWQAKYVADLLDREGISSTLNKIVTKGDRQLVQTPAQIGDKGLFTAELDEALLDGRIDLAVHSLKDLPSELPDGLCLAAVPPRGEPWDVLVPRAKDVSGLEDLPEGAVIGSSSLRRVAQLLAFRPDFKPRPIRGNVETRLEKLEKEGFDALVLAEAGLNRLGLDHRIGARLSPDVMLPAAGQGALGIVCATHRTDLLEDLIGRISDTTSTGVALGERAVLRRLEGGCQVPVGAYGQVGNNHVIELRACVAALDGSMILREKISSPLERSAEAGTMLAERLIEKGADDILDEIRAKQ